MATDTLPEILKRFKRGGLSEREVLDYLQELPFKDLGFAKVDHHRTLRHGFPEVIFGLQKTEEEILDIITSQISDPKDEGPYLLSLYGRVEEEDCAEVIHALYAQRLACEKKLRKPRPVKLIISTHGGDAVEMFSL